jgi:hypothetical protein
MRNGNMVKYITRQKPGFYFSGGHVYSKMTRKYKNAANRAKNYAESIRPAAYFCFSSRRV